MKSYHNFGYRVIGILGILCCFIGFHSKAFAAQGLGVNAFANNRLMGIGIHLRSAWTDLAVYQSTIQMNSSQHWKYQFSSYDRFGGEYAFDFYGMPEDQAVNQFLRPEDPLHGFLVTDDSDVSVERQDRVHDDHFQSMTEKEYSTLASSNGQNRKSTIYEIDLKADDVSYTLKVKNPPLENPESFDEEEDTKFTKEFVFTALITQAENAILTGKTLTYNKMQNLENFDSSQQKPGRNVEDSFVEMEYSPTFYSSWNKKPGNISKGTKKIFVSDFEKNEVPEPFVSTHNQWFSNSQKSIAISETEPEENNGIPTGITVKEPTNTALYVTDNWGYTFYW